MSPDLKTIRPLLDKLGVKPGSKVAFFHMDDAAFERELRTRTQDITHGKPDAPCDLVFVHAEKRADLTSIKQVKSWIEPSGGIWVVRPKGGRSELRDTDLIEAGLAAGLVDNKIASFSDTEGAMRFVFRLKDRPPAPARR